MINGKSVLESEKSSSPTISAPTARSATGLRPQRSIKAQRVCQGNSSHQDADRNRDGRADRIELDIMLKINDQVRKENVLRHRPEADPHQDQEEIPVGHQVFPAETFGDLTPISARRFFRDWGFMDKKAADDPSTSTDPPIM